VIGYKWGFASRPDGDYISRVGRQGIRATLNNVGGLVMTIGQRGVIRFLRTYLGFCVTLILNIAERARFGVSSYRLLIGHIGY